MIEKVAHFGGAKQTKEIANYLRYLNEKKQNKKQNKTKQKKKKTNKSSLEVFPGLYGANKLYIRILEMILSQDLTMSFEPRFQFSGR